jgi:hypothetical protein
MSPKILADSLLVHPALAGRTLMVRSEGGCFSVDIGPGGRLGDPRPLDPNSVASGWRGGPA